MSAFCRHPLSLSRLVLYLCPLHFDNFPLAAALCLLVDKTDELVVDVNLLGFYTVRTNFLFVYHNLLNQLVKDLRCQFLNIGVLPNQRDELLDIVVDFVIPSKLCGQCVPFAAQFDLLTFVLWSHGLIAFLADFL